MNTVQLNSHEGFLKALTTFVVAAVFSVTLIACEDDDPVSTPPPVQPDGPSIANITEAQIYTVGAAITTLSFANTGTMALTGCAVLPALPAGLNAEASSDATTCQISGTPTAVAAEALYTVTATNANGSDMGTVTITVNAAPPVELMAPSLADIEEIQMYTVGTEITTLAFVNSGGSSIMTCTVANPSLPAGLSATASSGGGTCQISGTPTAAADVATYTVTATNATDMDTATVMIVVAQPLAAPSIANVALMTFEAGSAIETVSFTNSGGGSLSACSAVGATPESGLPTGLSVDVSSDGTTCEITGIPAGPVAADAAYTVTATNATESNTATVNIAITVDAAKPLLQPLEGAVRALIRDEVDVLFVNSEAKDLVTGSGMGCTIDPALPEGLNLARNSLNETCQLTGMPAAMPNMGSELRDYTVTATGAGGSTMVKFYLEVVAGFEITNDDGVVEPNAIVITTFNPGDFMLLVPNTSVEDDGEGASPKMRYSVGEDGVVAVTVTENNSRAFFTTLFEQNNPETTATMDLRGYAEKGELVFEIMSADWGLYAMEGNNNHFIYKVDHIIPGGSGYCDCNVTLDVSGLATGEWHTIRVPIKSTWLEDSEGMARTGNALLNLQYVKTGLVLHPNADAQVVNSGTGTDVNFSLRNIRWEIQEAPNLANLAEVVELTAGTPTTANQILFVNSGGGSLNAEGGCEVASGTTDALPEGLTVEVTSSGDSCEITGMTDDIASATTAITVTITATNTGGTSDATVMLKVSAASSAALAP